MAHRPVGRFISGRVVAGVLVAGLLVSATVIAGLGSGRVTPATPAPSSPPPALAPGTYTSSVFSPALTFTVPAGWELAADTPTYLEIRPAGSELAGIHLFRDPAAASQDLECPQTPESGVGGTSTELAAWIRGRPGLVVGDPKLAAVGGLRGTEIDVAIVEGWTASCPFASGTPTAPLFVGVKGEYRWVVAGSERLRLSLLDVPGGGTLVVDIDAFDGSLMDDLLSVATPIVRTFAFAGSG